MTTKQKAKRKTTESTVAVAAAAADALTATTTATEAQSDVAATLTGKVLWFDNAKGYGFIQRDDGGGDVFVHFSGIDRPGYRTLQECDRVEFTLAESPVHLGRVHAATVRVRS